MTFHYRKRTPVTYQKHTLIRKDKKQLCFTTNDYLGLRFHDQIITAFKQTVDDYGIGSCASHLLGGYTSIHAGLEEEIAGFIGAEAAIVYSTGFMANLGLLTSLINPDEFVFCDRLNHASLVLGVQHSRAKMLRYQHCNTEHLYKLLHNKLTAKSQNILNILNIQNNQNNQNTHNTKHWIVSDGVFSVDGDIAPLPQLIEYACQFNMRLLIDDAHGLGVLGKQGKGSFEFFKLNPRVLTSSNPEVNLKLNSNSKANFKPVVTGSLSKAFGVFGGFVAADAATIESLIQFSKPYIYTTALPVAIAASARVALKVIQQESWRREKLQHLIAYFRKEAALLGLTLLESKTPIQLLLINDPQKTIEAAELLRNLGLWVGALRAPTVPLGQERLRITFSSHHNFEDVDQLLSGLKWIQSSILKQ